MIKFTKLTRRIFSSILALALAITLFPAAHVKAADNVPPAPTDYGDPISVTTYTEEDGTTVTERIYFYSDSKLRDKSGSGWYKNTKTYDWTGGTTTYYAEGYFVWGDGNVSVSNARGDASAVSGITYSNQTVTSGTGKYGYLFNNFAYVTYSFTATSLTNFSKELSVTIRVSESGNLIQHGATIYRLTH